MQNRIEDLRNHLFATLEALRDEEHPMEIDRAQAVAHVAQVIVNSAKIENEHIRLTGRVGTNFVEAVEKIGQPRLVKGGSGQ